MKRILILAVAIALFIPSTAFAASPTCQAYNPQECGASTQATTTTPAENEGTNSVVTAEQGTLPFTGLDVALLVAGGAALLGGGLIVRRLSHRLD